MINKFMKWLLYWRNAFFPRRQNSMELLVQHLIETQDKQMKLMADAINGVVSASAKQADVLSSYLNLFKGHAEPERWTLNDKEQNKQDLIDSGFPMEASESEQAEWILKHM